MIKRGATPVAKDRLISRNSSNQNKPYKDIKNNIQSKATLSRNTSNSKLLIGPSITQPTRYNPQSADRKIKNTHFTRQMRKLVVEWMLQVSHRSNMRHLQTIFIAIKLFDNCLALMRDVSSSNAQLLATTCLFMSAKYQEIYPESLNKFLDYTSNSYRRGQMLAMEETILSLMNFKLTFDTRFTSSGLVLERELSQWPNAKKLNNLVTFLLQISLLNQWENFSESQIGQAAVFLAAKVLKYPAPGLSNDRIFEAAFNLMGIWRENEGSVLAYLFDCEKWSYVGGFKIMY